jgi:hypothetical protein
MIQHFIFYIVWRRLFAVSSVITCTQAFSVYPIINEYIMWRSKTINVVKIKRIIYITVDIVKININIIVAGQNMKKHVNLQGMLWNKF